MSLRFPQVKDIPLASSPLTEVICQVRFPPVLSIVQGQPVDFQSAIRKRFPELEEEQSFQMQVVQGALGQAANAEVLGRSFHFRTADGETLASLGVDAYALSTSRYSTWDTFAADLKLVHEAVMDVYELPYAKRIGLRYINVLSAERIGCETLGDLRSILRPELGAAMVTDAWDKPDEFTSRILLTDEEGHLSLRIGARSPAGEQPSILLDLDYYEERSLALDNFIDRCDRYHDLIYRAFRWAIRPEKLTVFDPVG